MKREAIAKALIFNEQGQVLLLRLGVHRLYPDKSHTPDLPGGIVDDHEDVLDGLVREIKEELGLVVAPSDCQLAHGTTTIRDNETKSVSKLLYIVRLTETPTLTLSWEHEAYEWQVFDQAYEKNFTKEFAEAIRYVREGGFALADASRFVVCAKVLLGDKDGTYLVLTRSETHPRWPLWADLPGGEIEPGERTEDGLLREIREETGLVPEAFEPRLLHVSTERHEDDRSITHLLYEAPFHSTSSSVTLSWEHSSYSWRSSSELTGFEPVFQEMIDRWSRSR